jgi:hypothetical protein
MGWMIGKHELARMRKEAAVAKSLSNIPILA